MIAGSLHPASQGSVTGRQENPALRCGEDASIGGTDGVQCGTRDEGVVAHHAFLHIGSVSPRTRSLKQVLADQMAAPYFPVDIGQMQAQRDFYDIEAGRVTVEDGVQLQTAWLNHPQGCMGFRLETKDGVLVYATDNEPGDAAFDKAVRKLAEGADVLIYDAQYLPEEYEARRRGWGHSHWREAVNVVMESGAKELVLFHHDPDHTDAVIDKVVHEARNYYPKVRAASEGMEIVL